MDDLTAFLLARLEEDEQGAVAIFRDHTWSAYREGGDDGWAVEGAHSGDPSCIVGDEAMANHIARHDPARVLADVAAKRKLVEFWSLAYRNPKDAARFSGADWDRVRGGGQWTLKLLALPYADHPDYHENWKP